MMGTFKARMCRRVDYFFKDLRDSGLYYDYNIIHRECLKFCFLDVIQSEPHRAALEWNALFVFPRRLVQSCFPLPFPSAFLCSHTSKETPQDFITLIRLFRYNPVAAPFLWSKSSSLFQSGHSCTRFSNQNICDSQH